jgi:hypothetical protein
MKRCPSSLAVPSSMSAVYTRSARTVAVSTPDAKGSSGTDETSPPRDVVHHRPVLRPHRPPLVPAHPRPHLLGPSRRDRVGPTFCPSRRLRTCEESGLRSRSRRHSSVSRTTGGQGRKIRGRRCCDWSRGNRSRVKDRATRAATGRAGSRSPAPRRSRSRPTGRRGSPDTSGPPSPPDDGDQTGPWFFRRPLLILLIAILIVYLRIFAAGFV